MTADKPASRVLLVEDNAANMDLARYLLQAHGFQCDEAIDGESGLLMAQERQPDIVLCDLQLPGMDGFSLLRAMRGDPKVADIPVIAVTAYAMVGDRSRILAAGFNGYIAKPIDPRRFAAQIAALLGQPVPAALPTVGSCQNGAQGV